MEREKREDDNMKEKTVISRKGRKGKENGLKVSAVLLQVYSGMNQNLISIDTTSFLQGGLKEVHDTSRGFLLLAPHIWHLLLPVKATNGHQ